jgi:hypothetical protein
MTVIKASEVDRQMGMQIDPNSVPRHDGGDPGAMRGVIAPGSEHQRQSSQELRRGSLVYSEKELGERGFFGSQTVISVNAAEELDAKLDPTAAKPAEPGKPIALPPPPKTAPNAPPRSPAAILARCGYKKPPGMP